MTTHAARPTIFICSLWRNDARRHLAARVDHLLSKSSVYANIRWIWAVGDSTDETESLLCAYTLQYPVTVVNVDTGVLGDDVETRRTRSAASATQMFAAIPGPLSPGDYVCLHESDIVSPHDVLDRLLAAGHGQPCAAWPVIHLNGTPNRFYDIWAYRDLQGRPFEPFPPYCEDYTSYAPFEVSSFGSVWIAPAAMVRGRVLSSLCIVDLCAQWRSEGHHLWCDPLLTVEQPVDLWEPML